LTRYVPVAALAGICQVAGYACCCPAAKLWLSNHIWYTGADPPGPKISMSTRPLVAVGLATRAVTATDPPAGSEDGVTDAVVVKVGPRVGVTVGAGATVSGADEVGEGVPPDGTCVDPAGGAVCGRDDVGAGAGCWACGAAATVKVVADSFAPYSVFQPDEYARTFTAYVPGAVPSGTTQVNGYGRDSDAPKASSMSHF
jgi:hypothetical protein